MKVLVTGGTGLLGSRFVSATAKIFDVTATYNDMKNLRFFKYENMEHFHNMKNLPLKINGCKFVYSDITKKIKTSHLIEKTKPDAIVHTAALTDVDYCEMNKEKAHKVNVDAVENIVNTAKKVNSKLIFLSSDYVFNGKNGPYSEEDRPNPINYYGKTKLEAEDIISNSGVNYCIVRTTVLYGCHNTTNFATWVIKELKNKKSIRVVNDQYGNPTLADNLAQGIIEIIKKENAGIYNIVGKDWVNRHEFALKIAEVFGLDKSLIKAVSTEELNQPAPRPKKGGLKTYKARRELDMDFYGVEQGLKIMKEQIGG